MNLLVRDSKKESRLIYIRLNSEEEELMNQNEKSFIEVLSEIYGFGENSKYVKLEVIEFENHNLSNDLDLNDLRICDHCGKLMKSGFYLGGEYACSESCCLALYDGDKEQMEKDLSDEESDCYYTEWETYKFD